MSERGGRGAAIAGWEGIAERLDWLRRWDAVHEPDPPPGRWFVGGQLNVAVNCVDRHLPDRGDQVAIHWEGEPGDRRTITYGELHGEVSALAGALRALGVARGDRVALHLGWIPEAVVAMLACARIGAVHVVLATPLPADALADRLAEVRPRILFTQDGAWRRGLILPLKARADEALAAVASVEQTIVVRRTGMDVAWYEGDRWYHDLLAEPRPGHDPPQQPPEYVACDYPLLAVHLANRRGRPIAAVHAAGRLLTFAAALHEGGLAADDGTFWCAVDLAWLAGQVHGVYGPLVCGATAVMFEGTLDVPTRSRAWEIIEHYHVTSLVTTPSVVRNLSLWTDNPPGRSQVASLRRIVTAGEPIEPPLRNWLLKTVGRGHTSHADGWGQIELGGIVTVAPPSGDLPEPGLEVVDPHGRQVGVGEHGELVLRHPWAGTVIGFEGDGEEVQGHWERYRGAYATGDRARREPDGTHSVLGRMDDVVSISGQLVSLGEVRDVLREHPFVAEVEVVERALRKGGLGLAACVVVTPEVLAGEDLARDLRTGVKDALGGLAQPRAVLFVEAFPPDLPEAARRRALRLLAAAATCEATVVTVEQLRAAALAHEE
jgi:acetyl-CoA synthetase